MIVNDDSLLTIVNDLLKTKYIFWSESLWSENIQVISLDKKNI